MSIKEGTLRRLWASSFGTCAFPGCRQELVCTKTNDIIGHVCHIVAKNPTGPRGNASYTREQLDDFDNLLLLCPTHHTIVDKDTDTYTVETLKGMKELHYAEMKGLLQKGEPWKVNVSQIYYLNIPRLASLPMKGSGMLNMDVMGGHKCLHSMGYELAGLLQQYKGILNRIEVCSRRLDSNWEDLKAGQIVSFDEKFRTKNVPGLDEYRPSTYCLKGDLDKDPILYRKNSNRRFILTLDPRWLTATTSFVNFKMGWVDVAGLAVIKYSSKQKVVATPYLLGTPKNDMWDEFLSWGI